MRIWRDIISSPAWQGVVDRFRQGQGFNAQTSSQARPVGRVAQLRGVFDRGMGSRDAALDRMTQRIAAYHGIDKREYRHIDVRIAALKDISALATDIMKTFGVDAAFARQRVEMSADRDPSRGNAYTSSNPRQATLDRHLLTLARRSLRKAEYLRSLKAYYAVGGEGYAYRSPQALLALFNAPKQASAEFVGLEPGVRLEQLDPVHRSNYEDHTDGACGRAFQLWASTPSQDTPFFMWLETSLVCLADDKAGAEAQSVPYHRMDHRVGGGHKQRIVMLPAPLRAFDLDQPTATPALCTTADCSCDPPKDPSGQGGQGVAAYVWTQEGELFIAEHRGHVFHHSSFVSGRCVRCAGMIKIDGGRVTAVSNNSGHYKPRKEQLKNLVRFLQGAAAFAPNAQVQCYLGSGQSFDGTPAAFLAS